MLLAETVLEFDKIKELWAQFALTAAAKEEIRNAEPILSEQELLRKMRDTSEAKTLLLKGGNPPLVSLEGIPAILAAAKKDGLLSPSELEQIGTTLVAVRRLKDYLCRCKLFEVPLAYYEENLDAIEELREEIQLQIRGGRVDDNATKQLADVRAELMRLSEKAKEKADAVLRANKEYMSDSFCTVRNGRLCLPVKREYKFRISGSVVDKSSTGNTLFIEPTAVAKIEEELQLLRIEEENEERRILYTLTALVADAAEPLEENIQTIEKLDFMFSKGKLSLELSAAEPEITPERRIVLRDGRHPLMKKESCVPLQFEIGNGVRGVVITGPNTGGKTVAMKTVALACLMAQCGLHVCCKEAVICMNRNVLCDIGDGQNLSENLSTFSAHITNVLDILRHTTPESLVLLDELGSGTDPTEGMGIAVAILEELKKSGALFLVTTHYPEIKEYAAQEEGIVNARMTFDKESLKPLYQLVVGEAGESCAFYIAKRLGMPDFMLRRAAQAAYGASGETKGEVFFENTESPKERFKAECLKKEQVARIVRKKQITNKQKRAREFVRGDSVLVYPEKKIGIVCEPANEKGVLRVQLPDRKIRINHKRVKLHVAAAELYPEDYDFSIIFDTVENRKLHHQMERKYVKDGEIRRDD